MKYIHERHDILRVQLYSSALLHARPIFKKTAKKNRFFLIECSQFCNTTFVLKESYVYLNKISYISHVPWAQTANKSTAAVTVNIKGDMNVWPGLLHTEHLIHGHGVRSARTEANDNFLFFILWRELRKALN